jgi:hypothetical protein
VDHAPEIERIGKISGRSTSDNPRCDKSRGGESAIATVGGPTFDTTNSLLLVAVTSFGYGPNCTGVGGAYRLDQPDDLEFLADFGIAP